MLKGQWPKGEEQPKFLRMRTKKGIEIVVTVYSDYSLIVLQDCTTVADVKPKEMKVEGDEQR